MDIIAFDPGKTTGYCIFRLDPVEDPVLFDWGEIDDELVDQWNLSRLVQQNTVISESAVLTGRLNEDKVKQIQITERIRFFANSVGKQVHWVTPESKKLVKDVPDQIEGEHARDAYRVAKAWLLRRKA